MTVGETVDATAIAGAGVISGGGDSITVQEVSASASTGSGVTLTLL